MTTTTALMTMTMTIKRKSVGMGGAGVGEPLRSARYRVDLSCQIFIAYVGAMIAFNGYKRTICFTFAARVTVSPVVRGFRSDIVDLASIFRPRPEREMNYNSILESRKPTKTNPPDRRYGTTNGSFRASDRIASLRVP